MFINPKTAIEEGWITGIKNPEIQIQPNGIDITIDRVFTISSQNKFIICSDPSNPSKELKQMRGTTEMVTIPDRRTNVEFFHFESHQSYDILSNVYLKLPDNIAVSLIIRSTLCRNGLFLTSGIYDSNFCGHVGGILHNVIGETSIELGTRIGQIIFNEARSAHAYTGSYNHTQGTVAPHQ
jgi:dUTP pyrophosphatase